MPRPKGSKNKPKSAESSPSINNADVPSADESNYKYYVVRRNGNITYKYVRFPQDVLGLDIIKKFLLEADAVEYVLRAQPTLTNEIPEPEANNV